MSLFLGVCFAEFSLLWGAPFVVAIVSASTIPVEAMAESKGADQIERMFMILGRYDATDATKPPFVEPE